MCFESWCLCQQHAVRADLLALYTFLLRERIGKETRPRRDTAALQRRQIERDVLMWFRDAEA